MNFTLTDFERWLAQLEATGYRITTPDAVNKIRQALKAGGTMTVPTVDG